jgi:hypothetical protein
LTLFFGLPFKGRPKNVFFSAGERTLTLCVAGVGVQCGSLCWVGVEVVVGIEIEIEIENEIEGEGEGRGG